MNVVEYLNSKHIEFHVVPHAEAYSAQRLAQAVGVSGRSVAKTVLLKADGDYAGIVAILPANKSLSIAAASAMLGGSTLAFGKESDLAKYCPDCEFGVLPPFGSQYHMHTIMDASLLDQEEILFEGNSHHEAIQMRISDFRQIESPLIGNFVK